MWQKVRAILNQAQNRKLTFLYVTPERLENKDFRSSIKKADISMAVVDECHCVTEWGYGFRDAYLKIGEFIDSLTKRPAICACSATLPEDRIVQVQELLSMKSSNIYRSDLRRKNLMLLKKDITSKKKSLEKRLEERFKSLRKCIETYHTTGSVVIYALTTGYVDAINRLHTAFFFMAVMVMMRKS